MIVNLTMDSVVKIDSELEKKISELIKRNKFLYSSKKQVVNLAIIEFLNSKIPHKFRNTKKSKIFGAPKITDFRGFGSSKKPKSKGFLNKKLLKDNKKKRKVR